MGIFRNYSIQTKIMIFFISLAVLLFATVGLLFFRSTKFAINSSKRNELVTLSYETANKIERFMFERNGDTQVMALSPLLKKSGIEKQLKYEYLESVRSAYKTYDYIFITDAAGKIVVSSGDIQGDEEYKKWINSVLKGQKFVSDFIYINEDKAYAVYYASPIIDDNNKILGAVVERMNFNSISDIVKKVNIGKSGYAFLYKDNNSFIFAPQKYIPQFSFAEDKDTRDVIYSEHHGIKYITSFYPIKKYETQKDLWYLVVEEPYNEAFAATNNLRNYTIILVLISVFALFVLAIILSEIITKPIKKLVLETQNIVDSNIKYNIQIKRNDEVGSLALSFNSLLNSLKSMMQQVLEISGEAASLEEIRYYAESFFENMPGAVIIADNSGLITYFNETAVEITGIEKDKILGSNIKDFNNSGMDNIKELLIDGIDKQKIYKKHIIKIKNASSQEIIIMINISIQKDINDNLIGVIGAFRKVDEIKQFEESIVRAKNLESLGTMSAGMAHEIRNPLTSIKGYAQFIKSELGENSDLTPDIIVILNEVDRLNGIIDRFLSFARPQQLKMELAFINDIVKDVVKLSSKEILDNEIQIIERYDDIPLSLIDIEQMEQALLNIILNSIQAMQEGGILEITTFYDKVSDFIEVSIADTGCGIPLEDFDKIFEPFFTTKNKGTGLGLPISSRIIESHKGFIEVTSIKGKGTKFTIKLPVKK